MAQQEVLPEQRLQPPMQPQDLKQR
jgi:hypothetical protein